MINDTTSSILDKLSNIPLAKFEDMLNFLNTTNLNDYRFKLDANIKNLINRVRQANLTKDEYAERYNSFSNKFTEGEFPYFLTVYNADIGLSNNFEFLNKTLSDAIVSVEKCILFDNTIDDNSKEKMNYLLNVINSQQYIDDKNDIIKNLFIILSLFDVQGYYENNEFKIKKNINPFPSFSVFYSLIESIDKYSEKVLKFEDDEDISNEIFETSTKFDENFKLFVSLKYLKAKAYIIEIINLIDVTDLLFEVLDYIIDDEDIDAPILTVPVELFKLQLKNSFNLEDKYASTEGIDGTNFTINKSNARTLNGIKLSDINEKYKTRSVKMKKAWMETFKIGPEKRKLKKESKFFKKYFGRIPGLYKAYGSEARVFENRMKDDPAQILGNKAVTFIDNLSSFTDTLFNDLINVAKKMSSSSDSIQRMMLVKAYCKKYPIENDDDPKYIYNQIINETYHRIAAAIFKHIDIYGFTEEGIVQNHKFPSANHIVVSMFIDNPNETPEEQPVNQIFKNANSLLVFSKPENFAKFTNLYSKASVKVIGSFNDKSIAGAVDELHKASDRVNYQISKGNGESNDEQADPKLQKKLMKSIEKAFVDSIDLVVDQKQRVMQCTTVAYQMVNRVLKTAKLCVLALLKVESERTDKNYSDSFNDKMSKANKNKLENNRNYVEGNTKKTAKEKLHKINGHGLGIR